MRALLVVLLIMMTFPSELMAIDSYTVRVTIYDEFMHEEMDGDSLLVTVMEKDSVIIKKDITFNDFQGLWFKKRPLIVTFSQNGFRSHTVSIPTPGKRVDYLYLEPIIMKRLPHNRVKKLDEVTVTASTVKMVNRGDTIVYNADAFQLSQGSMLDELVRALPNVELRSGGRIYVNGRFVESLLLNGKDFFKGNPTVALSNLPSYTVKDVKVYEQAKGIMKDDPTVKKPLVMDVNLKKEFMHGWIANVEAGYGTSDRYLGRLFGLMFSPLSRLTVYGNANNTNDQTTPDEDDEWNPDWLTEGQLRTVLGGIDHLVTNKRETMEANTTIDVSYETKNLKKETISALYADNENLSRNENLSERESNLTANFYHQFRYDIGNSASFNVNPSLKYIRSNGTTKSESMMFNDNNPLNSDRRHDRRTTNRLQGNLQMSASWRVPRTPDYLILDINGSFLKQKMEQNGEFHIDYADEPQLNTDRIYRQSDPTDRWNIAPNLSYNARFMVGGKYQLKLWPKYTFNHTSDHHNRDYYQADILDNIFTYDSKETSDDHTLSISISQNFRRGISCRVNPNFKFSSRRLNYFRFGNHYSVNRKNFYANPEVDFNCNPFGIIYSMVHQLPGLYHLLDIEENINPLYVTNGNNSLSPSITHKVNVQFKCLEKLLHSKTRANVEITYLNIHDAIGLATTYDDRTGVTTTRPMNMDGNWSLSGKLNMGYYLDKRRRFLLTNNTNYVYRNATDMVNDRRNNVRNSTLTEKLTLTWDSNFGVQFRAFGSLEWRNINATANPFDSDIYNCDYGISVAAPKLPWDISVKTDFAIHTRRGYHDFDDTNAIWNIRLSKSFLHGNLVTIIDGYDLLGQLSNVVVDITPQGRTEARYNTLPRYAMLHVIYRLNIQPKKK